jgi:hypothetical protein
MSNQTQHKKRSYSSVYKIYRRIRFIRHQKKAIKKASLELKRAKIQEQKENLLHLREFKQTEKQNRRGKEKADRDNLKKLKRELRDEFRQRKKQDKLEWKKLSIEERKRKRQARKEEKKDRKRRFRHNLRVRAKNFFLSFRSVNIKNIKRKFRDFRDNGPKRRRFALISFNSTVLFLLSYFAFFLLYLTITAIAGTFFNYPVTVYYYEIYFNISQESWYHDSVKTIFSAGPLINFVIGITFLIIYTNIRESSGSFKLFFLWGFLHSVNMLFGALLVGTLFETGVGHVISWMYIMDTGKVLYSIISIFLLVIAGLLATKQFLISGNTYYNEINSTNRTSFIISQVLMPYLVGIVVLFLIRQPRFIFYDTFISVTLIVCIIPILVTYRSYNEIYFEEDEKKPGVTWIGIAALALAVFVFRAVLELGIRIGG